MAKHQRIERVKAEVNAFLADFDPAGKLSAEEGVLRACAQLPDNELGNADRLIAHHGNRIAYIQNIGWIAFDGRIWSIENGEAVVQEMVQEIAHSIRKEMDFFNTDAKSAKSKYKHWEKSCRTSAVKAAMKAAEPYMLTPFAEFDQQDNMFAVGNGIIDLTTGELEVHSPEYKLTRMSNITHDDTATCPTWKQFIDDITCRDTELADFLQRAIGYSMYATQSAQKAFFITGDEKNEQKNGSNGKSLFLTIIKALMGDYGSTVDRKLITQGSHENGIPNDLARLAGRRFSAGSEFKKNDVFAVDTFKKLTGDEEVQARFLRREFFEFLNTSKLWYATNYVPLMPDNDDGAWRRVVLIPFLAKFYEAHECPAGGKVKDENLRSKLMKEMPGILNWAIEGAVAYAEAGFHLQVPDRLIRAKETKKTDFDQLASFINVCIERDENAVIKSGDLRLAYERFAEKQGEDAINRTAFGRRLGLMGFEKDDEITNARGYVYRRGARLTEAGIAYLENNMNNLKQAAAQADGPFSYRIGNGALSQASSLSDLPADVCAVVAPNGQLPQVGKGLMTNQGMFKRVA